MVKAFKKKGDDVKAKAEIVINRDFCKGCGICVSFCPKKVLELDEHEKAVARRPENCSACRVCELRCPDLAIEMKASPIREGEVS
jgi:2-oxoglutarate ferredoxin oxidoreductase subunit delta